MGDSSASAEVVASEVVREEAGSMETVSKHTVTSIETSHMESKQESVVHVSSVVEQSGESVVQQELSQTHSITASATGSSAAIEAVSEAQIVDENANSIPDEPDSAALPPVSQPEPIPEPVVEPPQEPSAEVVPEPVAETVQEPVAEPPPEPVSEAAPEPIVEAAPVVESAPEPAPTIEQPKAIPAPEEISQENIKTQLHEIISEIEQEVVLDEDGTPHHTWRPKGKYKVPKTELVYEDIVPIQVPDVVVTDLPAKPQPSPQQAAPQQEPIPDGVPSEVPNNVGALTNGGEVPADLAHIEIPEGIPLLARILPKTEQGLEGDKKISLERLFTPATDSGDLTPTNKKKSFASSSFYRPDHPTIDDQVELAQRISFSLVDENNKMSRGQSMYMKRKKRSMRWIHQGEEGDEDYEGPGMELMEEESIRPPEKPPMKLLMSSKGVQDFQQVQEHYQNLMNQAPQSPEVNKFVTDIASPSGKGAELFAKRKKRMDKFIVDETNVQKSQTSISQQSSSFSSVSSNSSISTSQNVATGLSVDTSAAAPGSGAIYTAEVKVVQRASLPPTPIEVPHHSLLDLVTEEDKMDKRKSASFNLAAKGWGTYNKYYTPVTFAT